MTMAVASYVAGRWQDPAGDRTELLDAATSEPVAEIGAAPIDMVPVIDHARSVGGPALREMTFHERALALKQLALHLNGKRDEFYPISTWTGATRRDSLVDVDGGIGVLFAYGSKGRRELPNTTVLRRRTHGEAGPRRPFRRPTHLHAPPRRRPADQRLQFPGLGDAGEARPGVPGRRADRGQAGLADVVPDPGRGRRDHRVRDAAGGQPAAGGRRFPRAARPARRAGHRRLHRVGVHRRDPAHASPRCWAAGCGSARRPTR